MLQLLPNAVLFAAVALLVYVGQNTIVSVMKQPFRCFRKRLLAWMFLFDGADMITVGYKKAEGKAFHIPGPDHDHVFVSSTRHLSEIRKAKRYELSMFGATKQMFQPAYTMLGHNWLDERGAEGVGYVRAVGTLFPKQLMEIMPDMKRIIQESFDSFAEKHRSREGYLNLPAYEMHKTILCKLNGYCFFGDELSEDETFMKSIFRYNEIVINAAEVLRLVPSCLKWIIGPLVGRTQSVQTIVFDGIHRVVSCRLEAKRRAKAGECRTNPSNDMIQWIIDTAPKDLGWGPRRITYEIIAIWFGSVHALSASTTFALFDLCDHPEYIDPLRKEVEGSDFDVFMKTTKGLPLLDSFIKESARINPIESMAGRRQALKEFSFSDGTVLRKGDWACVPVKAIQSDDTYFPRPDDFFGFRFVPRDMLPNNTDTVSQPEGPSSYSDISDHYYSWGVGGIICPGRFYASVATKLIIAHILRSYHVILGGEYEKKAAIWRSYVLPREDVQVRFVPRAQYAV